MTRRPALVLAAAFVTAVALTGGTPAGAKAHHMSWKVAKTPAVSTSTGPVQSFDCVGAKECWAAGPEILHSTDGGAKWKKQTSAGLDHVSCPTAKLCWATADSYSGPGSSELASTTDGGKHWKLKALTSIGYVRGITCPTPKECLMSGNGKPSGNAAAYETHNGGASWKLVNEPGTLPAAVFSCPSAKVCEAAADSSMIRTTNGGKTFERQSLPGSHPNAADVSCASTKDCVAVGQSQSGKSQEFTTTDGGKHWKSRKPAGGPAGLTAVSCPTTSHCWAVGMNVQATTVGYIVVTTDGGKHWSKQKSYSSKATGGTSLEGVFCSSANHCLAGGRPAEQNGRTFIAVGTG